MDQHAEPSENVRDFWNDHNRRQDFEHTLIDRKTTWLLATQGLLFAAYGVSFEPTMPDHVVDGFRRVVAGSGIAIALIMLVGVAALVNSKRLSWNNYRKFFLENSDTLRLPGPLADRSLQWGVDTRNTLVALFPELAIPIVFIVAWFLVAP
jgi:hypothetical protein